jgi:hypothetical protein
MAWLPKLWNFEAEYRKYALGTLPNLNHVILVQNQKLFHPIAHSTRVRGPCSQKQTLSLAIWHQLNVSLIHCG